MPVCERALAVIAAATCLVAVGCGRTEPSSTPASTVRQQEDAPEAAEATPPDIDDPASALGRVASDLADGRADRVLAALPDRYKVDLDRYFNQQVRPLEVSARREAADGVAGLADVLAAKRQFVLGSGQFALEGQAADFVRRRFEPLARAASALARWPGWTADGQAGAESLITAASNAVAAEPALAGDLRQLRFETTERSADRAVVRVTVAERSAPIDVPVVQIDGRWIPTALADRWAGIAAASGSGDHGDREATLRGFTAQLQRITKALEGVTNQKEFDALAGQAANAMLAGVEPQAPPQPVREEEFVVVTIRGALSDEEKDRLTWEFAALTDKPASGLADSADRPDRDGVNITVGPVADIEAFAHRLPEVTVEKVDTKARTITARRSGP